MTSVVLEVGAGSTDWRDEEKESLQLQVGAQVIMSDAQGQTQNPNLSSLKMANQRSKARTWKHIRIEREGKKKVKAKQNVPIQYPERSWWEHSA